MEHTLYHVESLYVALPIVIPNSISPRRLGDRIRHSIRDPPGVQRRLPCTWLSKISMPLGVVTIPIGSTNAKMAKLSTLTLG